MPTEPEADADAGEDEEGFSHYEEFDKKRRGMLKEKLGVTLRLSQVQYTLSEIGTASCFSRELRESLRAKISGQFAPIRETLAPPGTVRQDRCGVIC